MIATRAVVRLAMLAGLGLAVAACNLLPLAQSSENTSVGFGWNDPIASQLALAPAPTGAALADAYAKAATIIEQALPKAVDLGRKGPKNPNTVTTGDISVEWGPRGQRVTNMPPSPRASRIFLVRVELLDALQGTGDAIADVWFVDPPDAEAMAADGSGAVSYAYRFDPAAARQLLDLFYRRG